MNNLQVFTNQEFGAVRTVEIDGKPYAVGADAARALGYAKPSRAIIDHCKNIRKLEIPFANRYGAAVTQETNVISEGDIYRLIVKAADQNRSPDTKAKAERFEKWIFDDVIPAIRERGAYITASKLEEFINDPDIWIGVLTALKNERAEKKRLQMQIDADKPKIVFAEAAAASDCAICIGELAKILKSAGIKIGQERLFRRLRQDGYLVKQKGEDYNAPTRRAMELGLFKIKETVVVHPNGRVVVSKTTKVTGKGRRFFINLFAKEEETEPVF